MNRLLLTLILSGFFPSVFAQVSDDFNDGGLLNPVHWKGDLSFWVSENGMLRSNGPAQSGTCISLYTETAVTDTFEWQFYADLKLATSSNNYLEFQLPVDSQCVLLLKLGGTPDEISFFRRFSGRDSLLIDGKDKRLSSSSSNPILVRLRKRAALWTLHVATDPLNPIWEEEGQCFNEDLPNGRLMFRACYSASNAQRFYLDDVYAGIPRFDTASPFVLLHYAYDSLDWRIRFSEGMDSVVPVLSGYSLNRLAPDEFRLVPSESKPADIFLHGFRDLSGNTLSDTLLSFEYYLPEFREVQITELLPDPNPPLGLPEAEFVEFLNEAPVFLCLRDWSLCDESQAYLLPETLIPPHTYFLISGNCDLFAESRCVQAGLPSGFLNNGGDRISLVHRNGDTLESLAYSSDWYGDPQKAGGGYSLEKIDPFNNCLIDSRNFGASMALSGGSPGQINSIDERLIDSTAPRVISLQATGTQIHFVTDEAVHRSLQIWLDGVSVLSTSPDSLEWILRPEPPLFPDPYRWHTLEVYNLRDCANNTTPAWVDSFRYGIPEEPEGLDLLITEVLFRSDKDHPPFVELYNRSDHLLDLSGCAVKWSEKDHVIPGQLLFPGETLVLCKKSDTGFFSEIRVCALPDWTNPDRESGRIEVRNVAKEWIDAMHYDLSLFQPPSLSAFAYSLERRDTGIACSDPALWFLSDQPGGTPGTVVPETGSVKAESARIRRIYHPDSLVWELELNTAIHPFFFPEIDCTPKPPQGIPEIHPGNQAFQSLILDFRNAGMETEQYYRVHLQGHTCNQSVLDLVVGLQLPNTNQKVLLNEILFDAYPEEPDFIELFNLGPDVVCMDGWKLLRLEEGVIKQSYTFPSPAPCLLPGAYLLITGNDHRLSEHYTLEDREALYPQSGFLSLPNSGSIVLLTNKNGLTVDSMYYEAPMHHASLKNTEGVSLERISPFVDAGQQSNWCSASVVTGYASPGYRNSQNPGDGEQKGHWNLVSPSFSPDLDGFEDLALLSWEGLEPGTTANIDIYSVSGNPVFAWANNLNTGTVGLLQWDGRDRYGRSLPVGPYFVHIRWQVPGSGQKVLRLVLVKAS